MTKPQSAPRWDVSNVFPGLDSPELEAAFTQLRSQIAALQARMDAELPAAVVIEATIHVERASQKGILIGKGGSMLKRIGTEARIDLEKLMERHVMLRLFVRVDEEWARLQKRCESTQS